jgi:signal transduction histidine kinase
LDDAVRALALDCTIPVLVTIDLPGRPEPPVESAAYFAIAEALTNAVKHARADWVRIDVRHQVGTLSATVTDDGRGGATVTTGGGLHGIRRRLATFDGVLALESPPGGPTTVTLEIPCALSSRRTSTSSETV